MILFLCYVFPPLAVLLMGRPFSAFVNFFLTSFGWMPGVRHALAMYADRKVDGVTRAIDNPKWTQTVKASHPNRRREVETVVVYDNPHVGKNGTYFRRK